MWSWLKRMVGAPAAPVALARTGTAPPAHPSSPPAPRPAPPGAGLSSPARVPLVAGAAAAAVAEPAETLPGFGPRRPLVGRQGQVAGFELRLAPAAERFLA
ncbi:MAG: hypothetical protein IPF94_02825 [Betaproteobacteria bacterium]|nr:hypothetical protein [Betaproteobacteria bacterium]